MINKGVRLKNLIEKNFKTVKSFADKMDWSKQKLDYYFKKEDIPNKALLPILAQLNISYEDFMQSKNSGELKEIKKQLEACQAENLKLSKQLIDVQAQLIAVKVPAGRKVKK